MTREIEDLLAAGAGAAETRTVDLDAVGARAARQRRLRAGAIGGTALAAVVATALVATGPATSKTAGLTATPPPSETLPAESPEPAPTPQTPTPTPAATAGETAPPATTAPPSPTATATAEPAPEPYVGRASGDHGLRVSVALVPQEDPLAGTRVALRVRALDDDGDPGVADVDYGDGWTGRLKWGEPVGGPSDPCATQRSDPDEPVPGRHEETFEHAWRHGGEYDVTVRIYSPGSCVGGRMVSPAEEATATLRVTVRPARTTSNGPSPVELRELTLATRDDGSGVVDLHAVGEDLDGWVAHATIDWGDGSPVTTVRNEQECTEQPRRYPSNTFLDARASHTFSGPGDYDVTVTFVSTGCDGGGPQEHTATRRYTVGP